MTTSQRRHYSEMLRRAREEHMLTLAAAEFVVRRNERGLRRLLVDMEADTLASIAFTQVAMRIDPEGYGECEICGALISRRKLDVAPWARRCDRHDHLPSP